MQKIIVVCGPTATGKSAYAVTLAKKVGGEIISADSRQVYCGLDIGSGKITSREMYGIPHYLLDVASPIRTYTVAQYQKHAHKAINQILKHGHIPIICGGSGFYIDALVYNQHFPTVSPNTNLRKHLYSISAIAQFEYLQKIDPQRASTIDRHNSVRLIRAIEIATALGKVPPIKREQKYDVEWHYLDFPDDVLRARIHTRLVARIGEGMIDEVASLHSDKKISWKRLESLGLEYRYVARHLQGVLSRDAMLIELESAIWHYAKRQRTWFKKYAQ